MDLKIKWRKFKDWVRARREAVTPDVMILARPHHWAEARQWFWYIVLGGCLPFWGGTFLLLLFAQSQSLDQLTGRGEFALFAAGVFASAIPLMRKRAPQPAVAHPEGLFTLCIGLLVITALVLSAVTLSESFPVLPKPDRRTMIATSILLFVVSIAVGFFVELTNNVRNDPDILNINDDDEKDFRRRFIEKLTDSRTRRTPTKPAKEQKLDVDQPREGG